MKMFRSLFPVSEEDKHLIRMVQNMKKNYPSVKVVGRGTVIINSEEIISSEDFKRNLSATKQLVVI
ncbi:MAG: hypothetical protein WC009_10385 [Methylotenera sp.]